MSGRIKLRRSSQDNPLYFAEPFTRWQARQDLLLIANHSDGFFYVRWNPVEVKRWQVARSEKSLCERRKRSRDKVRKFLNDLEKMQQIIQQKNRICSLYIIVNYERYQTTDKTTDHTTEKQQKNINKKNKEERQWKEEKKKRLSLSFDDFWNKYPNRKWRKKAEEYFKKKVTTQEAYDGLMRWLDNYIQEYEYKIKIWEFVAEYQYWSTFMSKETWIDYLDWKPPRQAKKYDNSKPPEKDPYLDAIKFINENS